MRHGEGVSYDPSEQNPLIKSVFPLMFSEILILESDVGPIKSAFESSDILCLKESFSIRLILFQYLSEGRTFGRKDRG